MDRGGAGWNRWVFNANETTNQRRRIMHEGLMTIGEVAYLFHVSRKTIYRWNSEGTGPKRIRVGSQVFYRTSDIEAFIDAKVQA